MTDRDVSPSAEPPKWQPISAVDRRVAGVLVEKAKTTPAGYPMTLNSIRTACNQKSNRDPAMELSPDDVEESLDRLRGLGAVGEIHDGGRVAKYRHYLYQWLGVDKVELAVMAELLLRGAQTIGELRGRAARMEPITDVADLRPIVQSLQSKKLLVSLTPEGRGQVIAHNLYSPRELDRIRAELGMGTVGNGGSPATGPAAVADRSEGNHGVDRLVADAPSTALASASPASSVSPGVVDTLAGEVKHLRDELEALRDEVENLRATVDQLRPLIE